MSQTEQKFDSLCTFVENLEIKVDITIRSRYVRIGIVSGEPGYRIFEATTPDQALTDALRYLRKIKTKQ